MAGICDDMDHLFNVVFLIHSKEETVVNDILARVAVGFYVRRVKAEVNIQILHGCNQHKCPQIFHAAAFFKQ